MQVAPAECELDKLVKSLGASFQTPSLENGHFQSTIATPVSFSQLERAFTASRALGFPYSFVGSLGGKFVFSCRKIAPVCTAPTTRVGKKRERDATEENVDQTLEPLKKKVSGAELETARGVLVRLHRDLLSASGESCVQSIGIRFQKLERDECEKLLAFVRIHSGLAVSLARLKTILAAAWIDGCVSIERSPAPIPGSNALALTEEASASQCLGNEPLMLVFSLLVDPPEPKLA